MLRVTLQYTVCLKKQYTWLLIHYFGKCKPIFIFFTDRFTRKLSLQLLQGLPPHLNCVATLPFESCKSQLLPISMAYCMWNLIIHIARYEGHLNSPGLNPITIKSGKQGSSAQERIRDVSELKKWMIEVYRHVSCGRQSLMKIIPVNGVNICELVFVPETGVFNACFNF